MLHKFKAIIVCSPLTGLNEKRSAIISQFFVKVVFYSLNGVYSSIDKFIISLEGHCTPISENCTGKIICDATEKLLITCNWTDSVLAQ